LPEICRISHLQKYKNFYESVKKMLGKQLFRQEALQKLSSPEELDQAITITDTRGWIALIASGLIVILILLWLYTGTIPVTASGSGILLKGGGVQKVIAITGGPITELNVKINDTVTENQVIAKVMRPELPELDFEISDIKDEIEALQKDQKNLETNKKLIKKLERKLHVIETKKEIISEIKSPAKRKILDLMVKTGDILREQDTVAIIEPPDENIEAIIYIPVSLGKKIEPAMEVQISPQTVKRDLYGFIIGKVKSVDTLPETRESMMKVVGNEELVNMFSLQGPPVEVHVELDRDITTESGYKWSSHKGPSSGINNGTLCTGTVILKKIHPFTLIFPAFSKDVD
jgi:hypothetical protein